MTKKEERELDEKVKQIVKFRYAKGDLSVGMRVTYFGMPTVIMGLEWDDKFGYAILVVNPANVRENIWVGHNVYLI